MIRDFDLKDIDQVNSLIETLDYKLEEKSFDNDFLKILVYDDYVIKGVLIYEDLLDNLTIDYIVVNEEFRNNGIATSLLKEMEIRHESAQNITLEVRESNITAINFYKKNGFNEITKRKHYYKNEDALLMMKKLR